MESPAALLQHATWLRQLAASLVGDGQPAGDTNGDACATEGEESALTSHELLARHQLQRLLADLVAELDEPFRATILLLYAAGLEPTELARRLGIPASLVRWRAEEALERLRLRMDEVHRGDRQAWLRAVAAIARCLIRHVPSDPLLLSNGHQTVSE
jgi:hypothetical protein